MNGRRDRILIPSAVALIAIGTTLWLASGGTKSPTDWLGGLSGNELGFLVGTGIVTIGIGYLCKALFMAEMMWSERCRFVDFSKLMFAFGLSDPRDRKLSCWQQMKQWLSQVLLDALHYLRSCFYFWEPKNGKPNRWQQREQWQRLKEQLLDEFHLRLHSHGPKSLIEHCSRRNTAWYIANTSGIASIIGWVVAVAIVLPCPWHVDTASCKEVVGLFLSFVVFVVVIPLALSRQGIRWNREFWGVCWKWIVWDQQTHPPLPHDWIENLPDGVRWINKSDS